MLSHWFILIGFGFSEQQSELILLSWNNSAPFVPVFYCLIPFILFYCQSFVSLGLQVISNPVGCYNQAFITQLPWFPCPFWCSARTCCLTWCFNPFLYPNYMLPLRKLLGVLAVAVWWKAKPENLDQKHHLSLRMLKCHICPLIDVLTWLGFRYTFVLITERELYKNLLEMLNLACVGTICWITRLQYFQPM